eukprot:CAMPEP_0183292524 /NCGR_PEP_ID=MMETSP0160_2-20130417/1548_1 /TAXON_ID=2839 ORGANISM="Odontella Sinensis, Strain Grunow 1884" /NCGR_SAMPLE_ID=MMETSP0160_2 /ASSEMBLY_ACC=CAM_ASM_000250 /LENGTH=214 /DNA_ID=CAMNT_0025453485 /DNA_START=61 /DNA_END=705 /DNA_ORIENTATION=-
MAVIDYMSEDEDVPKTYPRPSAPPFELRLQSPQVPPSSPSPDVQPALANSGGHDNPNAKAAGIGAGIVGLVLGGPFLALIAGGGGVYYSGQDHKGAAGDVARAVGDVTLSVRDRAREVEEKHQIVNKARVSAGNIWNRAKDIESRHRYCARTKRAALNAAGRAMEFERENNVVGKTINAAKKIMHFVAKNIWKESKDSSPVQATQPASFSAVID